MPVASLDTVDGLFASLSSKVGGELALGPVCTRVMLRTGVNLRAPRPDQQSDKALIQKVIATLAEMGYQL